jgi:DNA replication protein DnaC
MAYNLADNNAMLADNVPDTEVMLADNIAVATENVPDSLVSAEDSTTDDNTNVENLGKISVLELQKKYGIERNTLYKRMAYLQIRAWKVSGKAYLDAEQIAHMDGLHKYIKATRRMKGYPIPKPRKLKLEEVQPTTAITVSQVSVLTQQTTHEQKLNAIECRQEGNLELDAIASFIFKQPTPKTREATAQRLIEQPQFVQPQPGDFQLYRQNELNCIKASLLANSSIVVVGEEGIGKSVLAHAVIEKLQEEGFAVAFIQPATPKQMLLEIAYQLGVETQSLEGKALNIDQLKRAIATYLEANTAFLVIDDTHICDTKFRMWLKQLRANRHFRLRTGSNAEYGLLVVLIAIAFAVFSINDSRLKPASVAFIPGLKHGVRRCALAPPGLSAYHFCKASKSRFRDGNYLFELQTPTR